MKKIALVASLLSGLMAGNRERTPRLALFAALQAAVRRTRYSHVSARPAGNRRPDRADVSDGETVRQPLAAKSA